MNEESAEVVGDLELVIEEKQTRIDVADVCVSEERCVEVCYWKMKRKRYCKIKRSVFDIWKDSFAIAEKTKCKRTEKKQ